AGTGPPTVAPAVTGFGVPELPAQFIPRERLMQQLDTAIQDPVVLLCAPAGWGKTTLLASWVRAGRAPGPVVYFQSGTRTWDRLARTLAEVDPGPEAAVGTPVIL